MTKTYMAPFAQTPKTAQAIATNAVLNLGSVTPTNTVKLLTAGIDGAILTRLLAIPRATVTPSNLCVWISKDFGTTKHLIDSRIMDGHTVEPTSAIPLAKFDNYSENTPLRLEAGDEVYVGSMVSLVDGIVFHAEYTEY